MAEQLEKQDLAKVYGDAYSKQWQSDIETSGTGNHERAHRSGLLNVCMVFMVEHIYTVEQAENLAFQSRYINARVKCDMEEIARTLSGRLSQMDKRSKAANIRADAVEAQVKQFRQGNLTLRQNLHEMLARCATALRLSSPFLDKIGIGYPGIEKARGAVAASLAEVTRELPAVWSQGASIIAKHEGSQS